MVRGLLFGQRKVIILFVMGAFSFIFLLSLFQLAGCGGGHTLLGDATEDARHDTSGQDVPSDGAWSPPIDALGDPGWRDSRDPWCPGIDGHVESYDIWSHAAGVYALVADNQDTGITYEDVNHIYFNDGTGWSLYYEALASDELPDITTCYRNIMGLTDGSLFAWASPSQSCELAHVRGNDVEWMSFEVWDVFVVSDTLVYAIATFGDIKVIRYDGETWEPIPATVPYSVYRLWADEESVFAVGDGGTIVSLEGESWRIHDSGTVATLRAVWGFSGSDVWVGQDDGLLRHFDGETWQEVDWPGRAEMGGEHMAGMWGVDGNLFFHSFHCFVMMDQAVFTVLGNWRDSGITINNIWGNSPTEVFLAVTDPAHESADCGPEYLLWWDGAAFHWF